jgi:hypothetical protein
MSIVIYDDNISLTFGSEGITDINENMISWEDCDSATYIQQRWGHREVQIRQLSLLDCFLFPVDSTVSYSELAVSMTRYSVVGTYPCNSRRSDRFMRSLPGGNKLNH